MTPRTKKKNTATSFVHSKGGSASLGVAWGMAVRGRVWQEKVDYGFKAL